jgi:hypothetical protein
MAWNADGVLFFSDERALYRREPSGDISEIASVPYDRPADDPLFARIRFLWGLHLDAQDNVYVADPPYRRMLKIAPDGTQSVVLTAEAPWFPTAAYRRDDVVYV